MVNYAWRVEDMETDVRVFTACGDLGRLQAAMPDIDELAARSRSSRCEPPRAFGAFGLGFVMLAAASPRSG